MTLAEKAHREEMGEQIELMKKIEQKAANEGRETLNKNESQRWDKAHEKLEELRKELRNRFNTTYDAPNQKKNPFQRGGYTNMSEAELNRTATPISDMNNTEQAPPSKSKWVDPNTGREVRVLGANERLASRSSEFDDFDMSKAIRALATGDYSQAQNEIRAMDLSGAAAMVPTPVSQRLIDRARDMMILNSLGMQTVPMSSSTLTFARVDPDGDPTPEWKAENAAFSNSDVGISGVELSAKTIICGVSLSHELASDSPNASQVVEDTIAKAIAGEIDRAGLLGSGTDPEPQGIFGHTGVTDTALDASPTYDDFSDLYYRLATSNEQPNGLVTSSRTLQTLDQAKNSNGDYLQPPQSWNQFAKASTNAIPNDGGDGNNESLAIMGNFLQLFQGIRENLQIEVSRQASGDSENAWQELKVFIRVYSRIDFALGRPGAFQTLSGIQPEA